MIGPHGRPGGSGQMGDELTNLILIAAGGLLGVAFVLRAAWEALAAFLTGGPQPTAGAAGGVAVFFNPTDPGGQLAPTA